MGLRFWYAYIPSHYAILQQWKQRGTPQFASNATCEKNTTKEVSGITKINNMERKLRKGKKNNKKTQNFSTRKKSSCQSSEKLPLPISVLSSGFFPLRFFSFSFLCFNTLSHTHALSVSLIFLPLPAFLFFHPSALNLRLLALSRDSLLLSHSPCQGWVCVCVLGVDTLLEWLAD